MKRTGGEEEGKEKKKYPFDRGEFPLAKSSTRFIVERIEAVKRIRSPGANR